MKIHPLLASLCLAGMATLASAQTTADTVQRDVNQETRIRDGLQNGTLTTREAALLERKEAAVDRDESRALKDGKLSPRERARLAREQNRVSHDISVAEHNGVNGNPLSASSQRMQQAVQRDINQEQRIDNGIKDGQLTNKEVSRLERGQAHVDAKEFRAGRDGHVSAGEAASIDKAQDKQSARIHKLRHNDTKRHG